MQKRIQPRKTPQQTRSRRTRDEILQATAHLLNRNPFGEVSTNHIAKKTGISIGTLYKYYPNKDAILADLSLMYMQKDADLFEAIFQKHASAAARRSPQLIEDLVDALIAVHQNDAQVRGVVYQNLERLGLVAPAQHATKKIQAQGTVLIPELDPVRTWISISAINATVHAMSQIPKPSQQWKFVRELCQEILSELLTSQ